MPNRYGDNPEPQPNSEYIPNFNHPQAAITNGQLCNNDGYRGLTVCDHTDHTQAATRGMNQIRAIMGWKQPKNRPQNQPDPKNRTP